MLLKKFHGQLVQIITKLAILTENGPAPLIETGYVVDMDNQYLYLGSENPLQATKAVALSEIGLIDSEVQLEGDVDEELFSTRRTEDDEGLN